MEIISHRGFWSNENDKNSLAAFKRSFNSGYGTETDIRDLDGTIVISHDMPSYKSPPITLEDFFALYNQYAPTTLALNVKADGLQNSVKKLIDRYMIKNYVLFDMSIPDLIQTSKCELKFLTRLSEYESDNYFDAFSNGVWVDEFDDLWVTPEIISKLTQRHHRVFIVSPELHGRNPLSKWESIKQYNIHKLNNIVLCTDLPDRATEFYFE
ncbi:hypothetical protein N9J66_01230 [Gammaproteobacteria bacterium]|nr:hypothetical protein [Gammaproteobacteria bacterium]